MNSGIKMMLATNRSNGGNRSEKHSGSRYGRSGMEDNYRMNDAYMNEDYDMDDRYGGMNWDDAESRRRRDSRGRFRSDGGYSRMGDDGWMEDNYREGRSNRGGRMEAGWYPNRPFPVYEGGGRVNQIGFSAESEFPSSGYPMDATYDGNRTNYEHQAGYAAGSGTSLTKEMADKWMSGLHNEDGTNGPHWTLEQTKQVMAQKGVKADPLEFFVILNAMYADYCKVFKKFGVGDKLDFYVEMVKAFIDDKDAQDGKVARYFEHIVKH